MTITALAPTLRPTAIPVREVLPWAVFGGLLLLLAIYFVGVAVDGEADRLPHPLVVERAFGILKAGEFEPPIGRDDRRQR